MRTPWVKRRAIAIVVVVAVGLVLAGLIVARDRGLVPGTTAMPDRAAGARQAMAPGDADKGPHGGKYFVADGVGVEVTIFESGVPPRFRLYLNQDGKPLPPAAARVTLTLTRLGAGPQVFAFMPEGDYLLGDHVVNEPHSFDVAIEAQRDGKLSRWRYSRVEARVAMPDAALGSAGVQILTAGPATIEPTLKLPGEIALNGARTVNVVPRVAGVVVSVHRDLGERVKRGDVLAVIESQALADLRSQFAAARKRLGLARATFEREKTLWEEKISAKQDYLLAAQALVEAEIATDLATESLRALGVPPAADRPGARLSRFEVRAPINGVIVARSVATGEALKADADIFTVADLSDVWVHVTVYPKDLGMIRPGQRATVRATAFAAEGVGIVSLIGALVGEETRTARARLTLDNTAGLWRAGMFVEVVLEVQALRVPVAVAAEAIQTVRDWTVVFGRYGDQFEARPLRLGRSDGRMVEVLAGLAAGEPYVGGNSFAIKAELGKLGASHDH